jgi:trehalose 6-phosphate phosphatase
MIDAYGAGLARGRVSPVSAGLKASELAFFLDVDGTLVDIAATPAAVVVDEELRSMLRALVFGSQGAVALISGRAIGVLDDLFNPLLLPCAGLHGFERRTAKGDYLRRPLPPGNLLSDAREALGRLVVEYPALLLEDKRFALALHFRQAPDLEWLVTETVTAVAAQMAPYFEIQLGRCVVEIRPAQANKATAIAEFMQEPPFRGRRPICLGDDLTDEYAFEWVNAAGGLSIAVGTERDSHARAHLHSVAAARLWLQRLAAQVA